MRVWAVALALPLLAAGCGSSSSSSNRSAAPGTLDALLARPGPDVALVAGASDFTPGPVRYSFLIVAGDGRPIFRPRADVWVSSGRDAKPFARTTARLERIGVAGASIEATDVSKLYVARLVVHRTGRLWILAQPVGGRPIQAVGNLIVRPRSDAPPVGSKSFPSRTPTLASAHGATARLTTRIPPDRELLRYSIAGSLATHRPFVVAFATPKFCSSRTCGPVVDVVDHVRRHFERGGIRFIHVEIYRNNDPELGLNRWVREWRLPSEPWVFLVGSDGRIKARFEGSLSVPELTSAVQRLR